MTDEEEYNSNLNDFIHNILEGVINNLPEGANINDARRICIYFIKILIEEHKLSFLDGENESDLYERERVKHWEMIKHQIHKYLK